MVGIVGVHVITVHYVQVEYYQTFKNYTPPTQFHLMENSLIGLSFSDVEKNFPLFVAGHLVFVKWLAQEQGNSAI